jgi:hypothetical protein
MGTGIPSQVYRTGPEIIPHNFAGLVIILHNQGQHGINLQKSKCSDGSPQPPEERRANLLGRDPTLLMQRWSENPENTKNNRLGWSGESPCTHHPR